MPIKKNSLTFFKYSALLLPHFIQRNMILFILPILVSREVILVFHWVSVFISLMINSICKSTGFYLTFFNSSHIGWFFLWFLYEFVVFIHLLNKIKDLQNCIYICIMTILSLMLSFNKHNLCILVNFLLICIFWIIFFIWRK